MAERDKRRLILEKARQGREPLTESARRLASLEAWQQQHDRDMERAAVDSQQKVQRIARLAQEEGERKAEGQERTPETAAERTERLTRESRGGTPLTKRDKRRLILQEARERHGIPSPSEGRGRPRDR